MSTSYPPLPTAKDITATQFLAYLLLYDPLIVLLSKKSRPTPKFTPAPPHNLCELDAIRFQVLPAILKDRQTAKGQAWLNKEELQQVMAWKLAHGKFRPTLPSLISSNPAQTVTKTTKAAFAYYRGFTNGSDDRVMDNLKDSLKELCKLRGVGPATASLLLSIYKPSVATFLSDEQWRWVCWDETEGWKKKIRYTLNEWVELTLAVVELRERLAVDAAGVEKVAYVIGRFAENEVLEREVRELAGQVMEETGAEGRTSIEERAETIMEIPEVKETMIRDLEKAEARRKSQADSEAGKSTTANGEKELGEVDAPPIVGRTAADKFGKVEARTQDDESKDQAASSAKKVSAPTRSRKATDPVTDVEPPRKRLRQRKSTGH